MRELHSKYDPGELFCGIDGGGTTSTVVVSNREGHILHSFRTGTINHYGADLTTVRKHFAEVAGELFSTFNCLPGIIYTGNSALDGLAAEALVQELTGGIFHPAKVIFHSDTYVALLGFTLGEPGAMIISGTGSMACGTDAEGIYHTAGGWGQVLGDEGSGYHIALKGIKAALRAYDGLTEPTLLTSRLAAFFGLQTMPEIIGKIYNPPVDKSVIAAFAPQVDMAAADGDKAALKILKSEAEWLYKLALAITGRCRTKNLGYVGSVLNNNETIRTRLTAMLSEQDIPLKKPLFRPEIGALIGAFQEAGIHLSESMKINLLKYK